ncbi:FtsX-like permease family protein [Leifsonia sp. P73]|uniref:FtsX-like permease family protein n=1 Tax=Leifsonia sp. P73 TaxID=3423959 RepID=UPI003DA64886
MAAARLSTRWASGLQHTVGKGQALIGATLAQQLDLASIDLSPVVLINKQPFRVVGLVDQSPRLDELAGGVYLSAADDSLLQIPNRIRALVVTRAGAAQQVAKQAPLVINPFDPKSLKVSAPSDPRTLRAEIEGTVSSTLLGLTALALIAAIAGLANAMILAVVERRQEFGLRRAIGAQRKHVFALVISESSYIGLLGGVFGLVLGLGGILTVTIAQHWIPVFDMRLAPIALVGGIAVGAASGAAAAFKAARIQPSEALRL